jgi:hypothetical protein
MTSFLEDVIIDVQNKGLDISKISFILPNKRAGVFLKDFISKHIKQTVFSPEILSIEAFIEALSELEYYPNTELLFEFYDVYISITPKELIESFDTFSKWGQLLLQDFNEIDRYLIATDSIFNYLSAIKEINHWSLNKQPTDQVKNYISFWNRLGDLYDAFKKSLLEKKKGYQGLVYREAVNNLEQFIASNNNKKFVFVGFNALNKAEEIIFQELLQQDLALIYWDIDASFINDSVHDAGLFTRNHKANWPYFKKQSFNWITNHYLSEKTITIIGVPKLIGQAKYIGEILTNLHKNQNTLLDTAVVLGDENLLMPLLNSIPKEVDPINISMGMPLHSIPMASLFEMFFKIHKTSTDSIYFKDVLSILSNQFIKPLFVEKGVNYSDVISHYIHENNLVYLNLNKLKSICNSKSDLIDLLFGNLNKGPNTAIQNCLTLILQIKNSFDEQKSKHLLALEYLYRFNVVFTELQALNNTYNHINTINILLGLYKEIIANETLDFKGEPLKGLQIMGMLESRVLDFETVIISSVNEGVLPAGKNNNSFIPFDVKIENGLPTYKEKDAVYTYHFYRLLQRSKNVYILYNTEPDVLNGGGKSRFITQLEIQNKHKINHYVASPEMTPATKTLKQVIKTDAIIEQIKKIANDGFSPSSLTNYIRNPIDFYYEKVLEITSFEDVEEIIAANTLGSIIHHTLEELYTPIINQFLTIDYLKSRKPLIELTVKNHLKRLFKDGDFKTGKNLIIFEVSKRYVLNFLNKEIQTLQNGNTIKIIALEQKLNTALDIPELDFPIKLKGTVDRIDEFNGVVRIIDYKSGKVLQNQLEIDDWDNLTTDYEKYSKSFQILTYAYLLNSKSQILNPIEAGVISFKNLQGDYFLKFGKKPSYNSRTKDQLITQETLNDFYIQLKKLIIEICNQNVPFTEKPLK